MSNGGRYAFPFGFNLSGAADQGGGVMPGSLTKSKSTLLSSKGKVKPKTKTAKPSMARVDRPWKAIAGAYNAGATSEELRVKFNLNSSKDAAEGSKYSKVANVLTRLSKGVTVNGELIKITRGKKR